jgi:hypothetical protein
VSIEWRNPLLNGGGEVLIRLMLFWGLFLPLGAVWSVDRKRRRDAGPVATRVTSVAVAALFLQITFVYWFAAILKSGPEWRFEGTAIYDALSVDQLAKPLGHTLAHYPGLLSVMTFGVLALEAFGPFLLLSPFFTARARIAGVLLFTSLHLGIWLTLGMGIFPAIAAGCLVCFLPGSFWDRLGALVGRRFARAPTPYSEASRHTPRALGVAAGALIVYVFFWNLSTVSALQIPEPLAHVGRTLSLSQKWDMFAPSPLSDDGWYVIPGTLRNGRTVDVSGVLRDDERLRAVSLRRPSDIRDTYKNEQWRKYLENVRRKPHQEPDLGRYICRQWNAHHSGNEVVDSLVVLYAADPTLPHNRHVRPRLRPSGVTACAP